jgi:hypothetical protein
LLLRRAGCRQVTDRITLIEKFDEQVAEGAKDLRPGDEIVVLTWLHLSRRDELSTHPEDDMSQPPARITRERTCRCQRLLVGRRAHLMEPGGVMTRASAMLAADVAAIGRQEAT